MDKKESKDTIVLKFGGSSVSNNENLQIVVNKIKEFYNKKNKIIVVVSAQGKTTDKLIKEAKELDEYPDKRELDVLVSIGEQITIAKLCILLKKNKIPAISLTGWQAGIITEGEHNNSKISNINKKRIDKEFKNNKVVIIAGFQGINLNNDITTLGRGGSDTTAVALTASLEAKKCYIYSDVNGIYSADPNLISDAKKIELISYEEMINLSNEGAKVLHNRCVEIGKEKNIEIETRSTFSNDKGTLISSKIEKTGVKSIVKKDISRISFIGSDMINEKEILNKILDIIKKLRIELLAIEIEQSKITITTKNIVSNNTLEILHNRIII